MTTITRPSWSSTTARTPTSSRPTGTTDANGITGGHFGAMGGYSHTVELCPLQATSPQDHGECSSFAYVSAYQVSGTVTKKPSTDG